MEDDASGWLWFLVNVIFVIVLGATLAYGLFQWRHRNKSLDRLRDRKTRELYQKDEANGG